jgi:hypothetical protein
LGEITKGGVFNLDDIEALKQEIEKLREHLKEVGMKYQMTDPEMVGASQLLDALLNEYEKLLRGKS